MVVFQESQFQEFSAFKLPLNRSLFGELGVFSPLRGSGELPDPCCVHHPHTQTLGRALPTENPQPDCNLSEMQVGALWIEVMLGAQAGIRRESE